MQDSLKVQIQRLNPEVPLPHRQTDGSSGYDIRAFLSKEEERVLKPGDISLIPTGLKIAIEKGFEAQIRPRSGLALKHGVTIPNSPGTIDSDYRGEVGIILQNLGKEDFTVKNGMRIAQMVFQKVCEVENWQVFDELADTDRSSGGFGSTGV